MTPDPECLPDCMGIETAARQLRRSELGAMPIYDRDRRLAGMLTRADLDRVTGGRGNDTPVGAIAGGGRDAHSSPLSVSADAGIDEAWTLFEEHGGEYLPVLDGRLLVGIVRRSDLERGEPELGGRAERRVDWNRPADERELVAIL